MDDTQHMLTRWQALMTHACQHHGPAVTLCETCCRQAFATICADAPGAPWGAPDDETRCAVCAQRLFERRELGCIRGGCSMQPLPERFYAPTRVCLEYQQMVVDTGTEHRFYPVP